ncbi:MAG: hypothetical protein ACRDK4_00410 [Solirubrobacteraceae bacterium]
MILARRRLKQSILSVAAIAALVPIAGAVPAAASSGAGSPWWHLTSVGRPSNLSAASSKLEVQEITVTGTAAGEFILAEPIAVEKEEFENAKGELEFEFFPENATPGQVEAGLEKIAGYGAGNVKVVLGSGAGKYVVTFTGDLAYEPLKPISARWSEEFGYTAPGQLSVEELSHASVGQLVVTAANLGDASTSGTTTIVDRLPAGLKPVSSEAIAGESKEEELGIGTCSQSGQTVTCTYAGSLPAYEQIEVRIGVAPQEGAKSGEINEASATGGGAPSATVRRPVTVDEAPTAFGVEDYELAPEEEGGQPDTRAGSHPFQLTTTLALNQVASAQPAALTKDLAFKLPPGLIGNPTPFPQCTLTRFLTRVEAQGDECSPSTVVGVARVTVNEPAHTHLITFTVPLFNLEPAAGEPARFGFLVFVTPVVIDTSVRTGGDYGVTASISNITEATGFLKSEVTFWGVPGDSRHDNQRGWGCIEQARGQTTLFPCHPAEEKTPPPLLALPTSCTGPLQTSVEADSWLQPGKMVSPNPDPSETLPALDGCNRLPFEPTIDVTPDGNAASTPSGLNVGIHVPQDLVLNPTALAEANVKDTTVALPEGLTLNPAAADGLQACSDIAEPERPEGEIGLHDPAMPFCPEASKVGTVYIKTPLLPNPLEGAAYLAAQNANPFGSLVALYVVAEDPVSGTVVKLAGKVVPDLATGQLVSTFENTPQLPFEDFKLHFFGGDRAPLATPALCGGYTTEASLAPWSGKPAVPASSTFDISTGPNGGPCTDPLPFAPSLTAGTTSVQAGGLSPFTTTMSREDGNQNLSAIQLHMPPGVSGLLSSVKLCGEPQADQGLCGHESEIGETTVSVGLGGDPFSVKGGKVFITEGYKGAPYGLSIVNPAKAGPYDLEQGTPCDCVVVRAKIEVDPITAQLTVTSDDTGPYKIPTILDGIPLQIQHVNVTINRPGFTFNPTNCNPTSITGSLSSSEGATSSLSVPLQVTNCAVLAFKPGFQVSTNGKTSRSKGASLHVKLTYPKAPFGSQANIRSVKVNLPKQLPSNLKTLQKACPHQTFETNPAACSPESRVGEAKATTPLLPVPLTGPAYFVSYGGAKFPELVVVLSGYGTTVQLHGETFINEHTNVTSSTFHTVPDVPVGTFELTLPQGKYSALAAPTPLCGKKLVMPTMFTAQNGAVLKQNTPIAVTGCARHKAAKKHKGKKAANAHKHRKGTGHGKK